MHLLGIEDDLNLYAYVGNDPLNKADPTGTVVTCTQKDKCADLAASINKLTMGQYKFNDKGQLVRVDGTNIGGSSYYSARLDKAIGSGLTINIAIGETTPLGNSVEANGGGATSIPTRRGPVTVTVTGREGAPVSDSHGNPISAAPEFVLMHELVGHAIPRIVGREGGFWDRLSVDHENKVRRQVSLGEQRAPNGEEDYPDDPDGWGDPAVPPR